MALIEFAHQNKYGNIRKRVFYHPTTSYSIKNPSAFGPWISVKVFKYTYEHPVLPPTIFKSPVNGKTYIVPTWQEVLPETTLNDIEWIKPEIKKVEIKQEPQTWKFESSSEPGNFYVVRKVGNSFKCDCPGVWRSKNRECKHIKEVKNK